VLPSSADSTYYKYDEAYIENNIYCSPYDRIYSCTGWYCTEATEKRKKDASTI